MRVPIVLCANDTSWDHTTDQLIPGGQGDRYLTPIVEALPPGSVRISRQPAPGSVNAYMNHRSIYERGSWHGEHASVLLSHGIADKQYRDAGPARSFTLVAAPGPALAGSIERSGVDPSRIRIVGYPKLDPLHNGQIESPWPERDGRTRVLWAPTHGGGSERWVNGNRHAPGAAATTWWHRDQLLSLLDPDRFLIMEAPHPRHSPGRQATLPQYVGADVVIADGGSTLYEAWCASIPGVQKGLPVVFADWLTRGRNIERGETLERHVYQNNIGWHVARPRDFAKVVAEAAAAGITDTEIKFAEQVLPPEVRGRGGQLHAAMLLQLAETEPPVCYRVTGHCVHVSIPTLSGGRAQQMLFKGSILPPGVADTDIDHLLTVGLIEPTIVEAPSVQ